MTYQTQFVVLVTIKTDVNPTDIGTLIDGCLTGIEAATVNIQLTDKDVDTKVFYED